MKVHVEYGSEFKKQFKRLAKKFAGAVMYVLHEVWGWHFFWRLRWDFTYRLR